jgi:hypothetical protein
MALALDAKSGGWMGGEPIFTTAEERADGMLTTSECSQLGQWALPALGRDVSS